MTHHLFHDRVVEGRHLGGRISATSRSRFLPHIERQFARKVKGPATQIDSDASGQGGLIATGR
jgi:hypothetical protein